MTLHKSLRIKILVVVAAVALLAAAGAGAEERWFHVRVTEGGDHGANVSINLPLTLIETALALIPAEVHEEMSFELNEAGIELAELREFWQEVRDIEDATFVTVESEDETVRVAKEGDYLIVRTTERSLDGAQIDVRFPFAVIEALFNEDEDRIDLAAAIRVLAEYDGGDIVTISDGDTSVRVWVDDENESGG